MRHKKRSRKQKKSFRSYQWIGVTLTITFALLTLIYLNRPQNTVPADFEPQVLGAPGLMILSSERIDFGDVPMSEFVEAEFRVQNVGDETLLILGDPLIEVVAGCCPPQTQVDDHTLSPGEITTIRTRFTMHPGMGGPHDFRLHLVTNDPSQPEKELVILSNWVS